VAAEVGWRVDRGKIMRMTEDPSPSEDQPDRATRSGNLRRLATENREATWGDTDGARGVVPGIVSGDVGPKGRISAQLRGLSRRERAAGDVPPGTNVDGTGALMLGVMLAIAFALIVVVVLVGWLLA